MATEKQKMMNGELFRPLDDELVIDRLRARKLTRLYNQTMETDYAERTALIKKLLGSTEKNCYIEPTFRIRLSDIASTAEVESSNIIMEGFRIKARAMDILCLWPPTPL